MRWGGVEILIFTTAFFVADAGCVVACASGSCGGLQSAVSKPSPCHQQEPSAPAGHECLQSLWLVQERVSSTMRALATAPNAGVHLLLSPSAMTWAVQQVNTAHPYEASPPWMTNVGITAVLRI
jgi:hypothetical protein